MRTNLKKAKGLWGGRPSFGYIQFSILRLGMRLNSRSLLVINVQFNDSAWTAIMVSNGPMGLPWGDELSLKQREVIDPVFVPVF